MKDTSNQKQTIADQKQTIAKHKKEIIEAKEFLERIVELLSNAIELRDPYTKGHSDHVAQITTKIAQKLFGDIFLNIDFVTHSALLHDIGKIAISETALNKPTILTEAEYEMMKYHTTLGARLIEPVAINNLFIEAVLFHHEDFDGGGYPKGLQGEDIPLIARIIRVADYFDALTSDRPYRKAFEVKGALEIMNKNRNCFDPQIFEYFINNVNQLTRRCT